MLARECLGLLKRKLQLQLISIRLREFALKLAGNLGFYYKP